MLRYVALEKFTTTICTIDSSSERKFNLEDNTQTQLDFLTIIIAIPCRSPYSVVNPYHLKNPVTSVEGTFGMLRRRNYCYGPTPV